MDAPRKSLVGALACFVFSLGLGASTALADEPRPQDCTTFSDFSDELTLSNFQVTAQSVVAGGWVDVEIGADVTNRDVGDFVRIVGTPLLEGTGLVVASDPPLEPWRFDDVGPGAGPVASATPLRLRLQLTDLPTLLAGLAAGDLHVTLGAEERLKLKPGVTLHYWDPFDAFFFFDPPVPGLMLQWEDPLNGDMPPPVLAAFDAAGPKFYATVDPQGFVPDFLPSDRRHLKVFAHGRTIPPPVYLHDLIDVPFEYDGSDSPTELFESGTLCSGVDQSYGFDTHRTGEPLIDGEAPPENGQEPEGSHIQPVEFAGVPFANGAVTVSGQLAVHAARPRLEFRIRPTRTKITVDLELDMSMAAALEASRQVTLAPEERTILDVCLPLPPIPAGPVQIPMALEFSHRVSASASFTAAAAIGFEKAVTVGVRMIHDSAKPVGDQLTVERRSTPSPIEFSPPRFARDAEAHARVATDLVTSILIGDCSPGSLLGAAGHLRASAYGTFDAQLGGTPSWSLGHGESLSAGFSFDALGFDVAAVDLPPLDFPGTASRSEPTTATDAFAGEDVRWGVSIDDLDAVNAMETAAVAATADGGAAVVTYANDNVTNQLVRLDRFGSYLWHRKFKLGRTPSHVIAMPDDGLVVAGAINHANDHWVARLDASGNLLWARDASVGDPANATILGSCALRDIAALRDGSGVVTGFVVAGEVLGNPVTTSDACLVRLDADGNVAWGRIYRDADRQRFNAVTPTADGGFVAVGFTTHGAGSIAYEDNGLVVRVDADGDLLWAHAVLEDSGRVGELRAVVEGDDGRIFFAGGAQGPITNVGSLLVGRLDADGGNPKLHIVFGEDRPIGLPPAVRESPFDVGFDMTPVPGGIVVVGRQGLQVNPSPAVGPDVVAAWAFEMDTQLGIEWMTMFDGPWTDGFQGVARTANGFLVTGVSQSFLPLGMGFAEKSLAVMHLPFEGLLSFLPATNARATVLRPWALLQMSVAGASVAQPFTVIDAVHRSTTPIVGLLVTPPRVCVTPLTRAGHDSVLDACDLDLDADGVDEPRDNCAGTTNADQADADGDGVGDACDPPLCGNGVVEFGEACDDGNLDDADGCESGCVPTSQCAQVVALTEAKIVVKKLGSPTGDETITFAGRLAVPIGVPLDPIASGLQVAIEDLGTPGAFLLDLTERTLPVPGGALAPSPCDPSANPRKAKQDGWARNKAGTAFSYRNQTGALPAAGCAAGSARGLRKITLTDQRERRGYVGFKLEVNPTTLDLVQGPLVGSLVLTAGPAVGGGPCGSTDLPGDACRLNARGTTMTCD